MARPVSASLDFAHETSLLETAEDMHVMTGKMAIRTWAQSCPMNSLVSGHHLTL